MPAPDALRAGTLEDIRLATQQMDAVLATLVNLDNARLDPDAPAASAAASDVVRMAKVSVAGNGTDNGGACAPTGLVKRYWFPLRNFVSPVKDQGSRGTCWAFAAVGAVESRERVQNNNAANLSEQFLVNKYKHEWYPTDFGDGGSSAAALNGALDRNQALQPEAGWTYNPARGRPANAFDFGVAGTFAAYVGACNQSAGQSYTGSCSETAHQSHRSCTRIFETDFCGFEQMEFTGAGRCRQPRAADLGERAGVQSESVSRTARERRVAGGVLPGVRGLRHGAERRARRRDRVGLPRADA